MLQCNRISMSDDEFEKLEELRAELAELHYPWPRLLKKKDIKWLENERKILKPASSNDDKPG
jgi:hypothetical protein